MQPADGGGGWLTDVGGQIGDTSMRKSLLAGAMAVALATLMTTGAMALSQNGKGHSVRGNHAGIHGAHGGHGRRYVRGYGGQGDGGHGPYYVDPGPTGVRIGVGTGYGCSPTDKTYIGGFCGDFAPF
jgi:hypothetical protein